MNSIRLFIKKYLLFCVGIVCLALLSTLSSCRRLGLCKDQTLPVAKQPYSGTKLRLGGFYYGDPGTDYTGITRYNVIVPYANGVVSFLGATKFNDLESYVLSLADGVALRRSKSSWGAFQIQDTAISIGGWNPTPCGYSSVLYTGRILNDTTFVLIKAETRSGNTQGNIETSDTYNFRQYATKPDSTNDYVK